MKIAVIMDSVSRANGGIFDAERRFQQTLASCAGMSIDVLGVEDEFSDEDTPRWVPLRPRVFHLTGPRAFGYAGGVVRAMIESKADLMYTIGLWKYPSLASLIWKKLTGKPLLVAPHGMLDPWALTQSRWRKRFAGLLYQSAHLQEAACIRALSESEGRSIRAYGLKNPICIIPNGVDVPPPEDDRGLMADGPLKTIKKAGYKVLFYLGRIHPKKGLINLLRAWASNSQLSTVDNWVLVIAGWDQGGHEIELKRLATELGIAWTDVRETSTSAPPCLLFIGPQFDDSKDACFRNIDAFILPSFGEGLPMSVLEAWSYGKPVLMTPECNLPEGFAANAALQIEPRVDGIARGLRDLTTAPSSSLHSLGSNGRALVTERFTWSKIARAMVNVYEWVLGSAPRPDCVQLH
jgi:glycosyltransferase involved in cell wall biosynthesis